MKKERMISRDKERGGGECERVRLREGEKWKGWRE